MGKINRMPFIPLSFLIIGHAASQTDEVSIIPKDTTPV
ncbi:hypothetical protein AOT82_2544 [Psychrobacter sp. AntiMn-1]|nr:hypothetical protein AOT82_2544 [Psychrobacter sp. AntiMn-1]